MSKILLQIYLVVHLFIILVQGSLKNSLLLYYLRNHLTTANNNNTSSQSSSQSSNTRSKSMPAMICSIINDNKKSEYLNVTVTKCKQITTQQIKPALPTILSPGISPLKRTTEDVALVGANITVEAKAYQAILFQLTYSQK